MTETGPQETAVRIPAPLKMAGCVLVLQASAFLPVAMGLSSVPSNVTIIIPPVMTVALPPVQLNKGGHVVTVKPSILVVPIVLPPAGMVS